MKLQKRLEIAGFRRKGNGIAYTFTSVDNEYYQIELGQKKHLITKTVRFVGEPTPKVSRVDVTDEELMDWLNVTYPLPTFDELLEKNYPDYVFNFEKIGYVERVSLNSVTILVDGYEIHGSMEDWEADILLDGFRKLFKSQRDGLV